MDGCDKECITLNLISHKGLRIKGVPLKIIIVEKKLFFFNNIILRHVLIFFTFFRPKNEEFFPI